MADPSVLVVGGVQCKRTAFDALDAQANVYDVVTTTPLMTSVPLAARGPVQPPDAIQGDAPATPLTSQVNVTLTGATPSRGSAVNCPCSGATSRATCSLLTACIPPHAFALPLASHPLPFAVSPDSFGNVQTSTFCAPPLLTCWNCVQRNV